MRIMDNFELEGSVAIENYTQLCESVHEGDILIGKPCTEGMAFYKGENIIGYLFIENCLIVNYAYNNGYDVIAKVVTVDKTKTFPEIVASLHVLLSETRWGSMGHKIEKE